MFKRLPWRSCGFSDDDTFSIVSLHIVQHKTLDPKMPCTFLSGWWFGTLYIFPYIGNNHPNWLIFFRGFETTNQFVNWFKLMADSRVRCSDGDENTAPSGCAKHISILAVIQCRCLAALLRCVICLGWSVSVGKTLIVNDCSIHFLGCYPFRIV